MHPVFFGLKRAHHLSVAVARNLTCHFGLTPARFDMLLALERARPSMRQRDLRRILGVSAPTVSRMLKALESLGLVLRRKEPLTIRRADRRHRRVMLTDRGRARIRAAMRSIFGPAAASWAVECSLSPTWWSAALRRVHVNTFLWLLSTLRRSFGDIGNLEKLLPD